MGLSTAMGIASTNISIEQQLDWHLKGNFYPPIPSAMIEPCIAAIDAGNEEDWNREIELPFSILYKGLTTAPAYAIIEQHHLDPWIDNE